MGNQRIMKAVIVVTIGLAVILGACTRSASTPPPATQSGETTPSGLTAQQETMEAVRSDLLTQTAQAETGEEEETEVPPTETPEPTSESEPTAEPTEEVTPAAAATTEPGEVPSSYTLKDGENPYCIARRFDLDPVQFLAVNGLEPSSIVPPGTTLAIPENSGSFPPPRSLRPHPTTYTVPPGETLYAVACRFGDVYPEAIAEANGLTEPYNVTAGQVLEIP